MHYELTFQPIVYEIATLASIIVMFTKGTFHLSELAGPDLYRTSYFDNEIGFFQGYFFQIASSTLQEDAKAAVQATKPK